MQFQIYIQLIILSLNFIISANCTARRKYRFGHANLCLNLLEMSILIRRVFQVKRTMDVHIKIYTITAGRPCTCVLMPLHNIRDIFFIFKDLQLKENGDINNYISLLYKRRQKISFLSSKRNIILASIKRKAKQRMSNHLNTN